MATTGDSSTFQALINLIKSRLGSASYKNVPASGNAGNDEVVLGNDTRLTKSGWKTVSFTQSSAMHGDVIAIAKDGICIFEFRNVTFDNAGRGNYIQYIDRAYVPKLNSYALINFGPYGAGVDELLGQASVTILRNMDLIQFSGIETNNIYHNGILIYPYDET